jgi:prephenate dehydratase
VSNGARRLLTYLGPPGSFTHSAVESIAKPWTGSVAPRSSVEDVIFAVESGEAAAGMLPLETSVEGDVSSSIDELIFRSSVCFLNEVVVVPVTYVVAGMPGARWGTVRRLVTTSVAMTQCRRFLESAGVQVELVGDVDMAAQTVAEAGTDSVAAMTTAMSAHLNALAVLRSGVEDHSGVATRMALFSRRIPAPTGHDETMIVVTPIGDRTGVLAEILHCFSDRGIALTAISSRPMKTRLGEYCFLLTARSHVADPRFREALQATADLPAEIKLLGSFPASAADAAPRVDEAAPPGSVDSAGLQPWIDTVLQPEQLDL